MKTGGHQRLPSWVVGFHGSDKRVGLDVLSSSRKHLRSSRNDYDWLGSGIYFWENDPHLAKQFAMEGIAGRVTRGRIKDPFVIEAIIDLGLCCNLFDQQALQELKAAHEDLAAVYKAFDLDLPQNKGGGLVRYLDRAVIEHMHDLRATSGLPSYQTVRAGFGEGTPLWPGTTITAKHHIQISVRDPSCTRGYFLPRGG